LAPEGLIFRGFFVFFACDAGNSAKPLLPAFSKYRFAKSEIKNLNGHLVGHTVDFLIAARRPKDIFLMTGSPWTAFGGNGA
jgi:hypothetical protein